MQRRAFTQAALMSTATLALPSAFAQAAAFKEGADYLKLGRPAPVDAPAGKVEVVEFFGYWCPHCASFEPTFHAWTKKVPAHVVVRRSPVAFREDTVPLQRLYFAIEAMGRIDDLHGKVFTAIHGERQRLNTAEQITEWVVKQGVDKEKFLGFYNSFGVAGKVQRAKQLSEAYQIDGVPSLGVAGQYYTSGTQAKSLQRALGVVEQLADFGRKG
ncbi:MAG: thiol:disulfide interchange protein DsbA/DsbL [Burkholderiaceae bacterium]